MAAAARALLACLAARGCMSHTPWPPRSSFQSPAWLKQGQRLRFPWLSPLACLPAMSPTTAVRVCAHAAQVFACTVGQKPSKAPFYLNDPMEVSAGRCIDRCSALGEDQHQGQSMAARVACPGRRLVGCQVLPRALPHGSSCG